MGQFSWFTGDTHVAIRNNAPHEPVYMKDDKGGVWVEEDYEGYGVFGGMDYYALVAEMNGKGVGDVEIDRYTGIDMIANVTGNGGMCSVIASKHGIKSPTLSFDPDHVWNFTAASESDPNQGWGRGSN